MRWDSHNQQRRRHILDAALQVVEEHPPGATIRLQQIADRAGVGRTVIYRHFADRADLDRSVQAAIVDALSEELLPAVSLDGTVPEIIARVVSRYVEWAVAHPALHRMAEQDTGFAGGGALQRGLERIAEQVLELVVSAVDVLGLELGEDERAALDPLVFGFVGAAFSAVRRWLAKPERTPGAAAMVELVTRSIWHLLDGHARRFGLVLDPDQPIEELLGLGSRAGS